MPRQRALLANSFQVEVICLAHFGPWTGAARVCFPSARTGCSLRSNAPLGGRRLGRECALAAVFARDALVRSIADDQLVRQRRRVEQNIVVLVDRYLLAAGSPLSIEHGRQSRCKLIGPVDDYATVSAVMAPPTILSSLKVDSADR
jgi:hypothetical protein